MLSTRLLGLAALVSLSACSVGDLPPVSIGLEFGTSVERRCPSEACADYGLECGAVVSIRAYEAEANPGDDAIAELCVEVASAASLCSLSELGLGLGELDAQRVRLEIAMWTPEQVGALCPAGPLFDLQGIPFQTFDPQPAFAGARTVDLGSRNLDVAGVPLTCASDNPLNNCGEELLSIRATVDDLDTLLFVPSPGAENLLVSVGEPRPLSDPEGTRWVIPGSDDYPLELTEVAPVPRFTAELTNNFTGAFCVIALDDAPESTSAVSCGPPPSFADEEIAPTGYRVRKERLDSMLDALALDEFPPGGLVIGRVIDHLGQPVAGVTVEASSGTGDPVNVVYLSQDFSLATTGPTAGHGYFTTSEAPFSSVWSALHPDGRTQQVAPVAGLIEGRITVVVLQLEEPLGDPR